MAQRGRFITLEGGEGSGKSTQVQLLAERLRAKSIDFVTTREPGGTPFAEALRSFLLDAGTPSHSALSEALLFNAARSDHLDRVIRPALTGGTWVICDRFYDSTRVYQGGTCAVSASVLDDLDRAVVAPDFPDVTYVFDIDPDIGLTRAEQRRATKNGAAPGADRYEGREINFHRKLRDAFRDLVKRDPGRCVLIDGNVGADVISERIWQDVTARFRDRSA